MDDATHEGQVQLPEVTKCVQRADVTWSICTKIRIQDIVRQHLPQSRTVFHVCFQQTEMWKKNLFWYDVRINVKEPKSNSRIMNLLVSANNIMKRKWEKSKNAVGGRLRIQRCNVMLGKQSWGRGGVAPRWGSKDLWAVSSTNQASRRQHSSQEQRQQLGSSQQPGSRAANYPKAATATESLNWPARPA